MSVDLHDLPEPSAFDWCVIGFAQLFPLCAVVCCVGVFAVAAMLLAGLVS